MIANRKKLTEQLKNKHRRELDELTKRIQKEQTALLRMFDAQQERITARKRKLGMEVNNEVRWEGQGST